MDIADTRKCNLWNLQQLGRYLYDDPERLLPHYDELLQDEQFLQAINDRLHQVRSDHQFYKGIFHQQDLSTVDWFAFERVLLYSLIREHKPQHCLETGVYYGGNTAFILVALAKNGSGQLVSIDYPATAMTEDFTATRHPDVGDSEVYDKEMTPGFIIPEHLHAHWQLILGDSLQEIPKLNDSFQFYIHDSEHSHDFVYREMTAAWAKLSPNALIVADDIDWSNGFLSFCVEQRLLPLFLTDNGKDNLRVRMGVARRDHPRNECAQATGAP